MPSTKRASLPAKIATLALAATILAALVAHASLSTGCGKAPATTASAEPARAATTAAPSAAPPAASATTDPDDDVFLSASKSGAVVRPRKARPAPDAGATP